MILNNHLHVYIYIYTQNDVYVVYGFFFNGATPISPGFRQRVAQRQMRQARLLRPWDCAEVFKGLCSKGHGKIIGKHKKTIGKWRLTLW